MTAFFPSVARAARMRSSHASSASGLKRSNPIVAISIDFPSLSENPDEYYMTTAQLPKCREFLKSALWSGLFVDGARALRQLPYRLGVAPGKNPFRGVAPR